jgi:hypothetical protein
MLFACFRTANKRAGMIWGFTGEKEGTVGHQRL